VSSVPEIGKDGISLRYREDRFRLLVEAVRDYAIFLMDTEGRILSWNSGAERIKGYKSEEIIGKDFSIFYRPEDIRAGKPWRQLEQAKREGGAEDEGWRLRKDGSTFWANAVITALRDEQEQLCGFVKITRDLTEMKRSEEALHNSMDRLLGEIEQRAEAERSVRDLSARLLRLQDDERRRLGRELHDSVGQLLVGIKLSLGALESQANKEEDFSRELAECRHLLDTAMREVRTMSYLLYPPMLEETGLRATVEWYLEGFRQRSGIDVKFEAALEFERLSREAELVLFRVLQESLANVHRHSGSSTAEVRLKREGGNAVLEVEDQGRGLLPAALEPDGRVGSLGVGLRGMSERLRQLAGRLELASSGKGTIVRATVPATITEATFGEVPAEPRN
jgi:PAS domain S-box-containing protein